MVKNPISFSFTNVYTEYKKSKSTSKPSSVNLVERVPTLGASPGACGRDKFPLLSTHNKILSFSENIPHSLIRPRAIAVEKGG